MDTRRAEILMAAVVLARSTSFAMSKSGLDSMSPMNLLGIRFLLAFFILFVLFSKRIRNMELKTLRNGIIIGVIYTLVMAAEMIGLKYADSSEIAFLENSAIVIVPAAEAVISRKLPGKAGVAGTVITVTGVAFLTLTGGIAGFGIGEAAGILSAVFYACGIIATDRLSKNDDALCLGIVQVGTMGVLSMAVSFICECPVLPQSGHEWLLVLWLAVVCTGFGFTLQPLAQKYITSQRSGTICALNPLGAWILGIALFGETPGIWGIAGAVLVMTGILIQSKEGA